MLGLVKLIRLQFGIETYGKFDRYNIFFPSADSLSVSRLPFTSVFFLQSHQKIAEHLVLALTVLCLSRIPEKGTQLVLA
jgi:hypothetical protein